LPFSFTYLPKIVYIVVYNDVVNNFRKNINGSSGATYVSAVLGDFFDLKRTEKFGFEISVKF